MVGSKNQSPGIVYNGVMFSSIETAPMLPSA